MLAEKARVGRSESDGSEGAGGLSTDRVTIGIINYNGRQALPDTIAAVKGLDYPAFEVLVVDNNSTDGSREWMKANHPDIRCFGLECNIGSAGARNLVLQEATAEYVLLLDNDISVEPDTLTRLMEVMKTVPGVGACHPEITDPEDPEVYHYNGGYIHYLCALVTRPEPEAEESRPWFEQFAVIGGAALLVRKDVALGISGFDADYFFNWEDGDFTARLTLAGYKVLNVPEATARHRSKPRGTSKVFYQVRNRWYFILKLYSWRTILLSLPMLACFEIAQGLLLLLKGAGKEYVKGSVAAVADLPRILRKRRAFQRLKVVGDAAWLTSGPMYVTVGRPPGRLVTAAQKLLYSIFDLYWLPVKLSTRAKVKPTRQMLTRVLRLLFTAGLLTFLVHRIGLDQISTVLHSLNPAYYAAILAMLLVDTLLRAYNWGNLLRTRGIDLSLREMVYAYLTGGFFGTFIPSSLGADFSRAYLIARRNKLGGAESASAILVLNLIGMLALCLIGIVSSLVLLFSFAQTRLALLILAGCLAFVAFFPLLLRGGVALLFVFNLPVLQRFRARVEQFSQALASFAGRRATMAGALGIAFLNQGLSILIVFTISLFLALDIPFIYFVAFIPVVTLSRLIPISVAGLGAEQGIFVFLFHQAGVPAAEAFLMSLTLSVTNLSFLMIGGLLYAAGGLLGIARTSASPT
jgi:uncharacterized protein (TIRG00374 family)